MEQHEDTDVHNCQPSATQHEQISSFPHISKEEFDQACDSLANRFASHSAEQTSWQSVDIIRRDGSQYLRIAKLLTSVKSVGEDVVDDEDNSEFEEQEDDEETLLPTTTTHATIQYDMALSPSYRVPVLYFSIKDPSYRYPPTMQTLYEHIIHPEFKPQVENVGVIGGITIIDHPFSNNPVFFIHPCQTAAVLEASAGARLVTPVEYLVLWTSAMGKCVGLDVPVVLARD